MKLTQVTGLWDLGRQNLQDGWDRPFSKYLECFEKLLKAHPDVTFVIFGSPDLEAEIFKWRTRENTHFVPIDLEWFRARPEQPLIQNLRTNPQWYNQAGWLKDSTQAKLELQNPMVMAKMQFLQDASVLNPFDADTFFWIDGGIANTVQPQTIQVTETFLQGLDHFWFICFPYDGRHEVHGFQWHALKDFAKSPTDMVARGGFFGGRLQCIAQIYQIQTDLLMETLEASQMGTEESIFTIMTQRYPQLIQYSTIDMNGLLQTVFDKECPEKLKIKIEQDTAKSGGGLGIYVLTFQSPKQFKALCDSMQAQDPQLMQAKKYCVNNTTDLSFMSEQDSLCTQYGFEHLKMESNLGITRARVWIAKHFHESNLDQQIFFEDDMLFFEGPASLCRSGFPRKVSNLVTTMQDILKKEKLDFLKMNQTEFFGTHKTQWAWYNVPQAFRELHWPKNKRLPEQGMDSSAPRLKVDVIDKIDHHNVSYLLGEVWLCNWPILFSKDGNFKCQLETTFAHPFEQTLMSQAYQQMVRGRIKAGVLLASPTEHQRFDHQDGTLRKEC